MSGLAVASLILGVLGFFTVGVTSLIGLILGIVSLVRISGSEGRERGHGLALAGTIISGFTLLMLPVMVAILFPVFGRAREKARQASCMSNLKQLGLGAIMYAQDYGQVHPIASNWSDAMMPYVRNNQIFICPSAADQTQHSYAYSASLDQLRLAKVVFPARTVMLFDSQPGDNLSGGLDLVVSRHNGGANFTFDDGHVKWVRASGQASWVWDPLAASGPSIGGAVSPPPWAEAPNAPPTGPSGAP